MLTSPALLLHLSGRPDPLRHPSPPPDYPLPPAYASTTSLVHSPRASSSAFTLESSALEQLDARAPLPAYNAPPTLAPWLALLAQPHWETSADLGLFLAPGKNGQQQLWGEECAALTQGLIERGAELDPCSYVRQDYMFESVPPGILEYVRTEIPKELRSGCLSRMFLLLEADRHYLLADTALTFACRTEPPEPLVLNPLFTGKPFPASSIPARPLTPHRRRALPPGTERHRQHTLRHGPPLHPADCSPRARKMDARRPPRALLPAQPHQSPTDRS